MVSLSAEQFKELLRAANKQSERCGSFSGCRSSLNGERNPARVKEIISAVTTYKTVESILDANAANGMPMFLAKATTFADLVKMFRDAFSPPKSAWRIYAEIYNSKQQKNERTDTFICKKRLLFSQLDKIPDEADQFDMVF
uniref:Uncharacterized protein n=1 Tax=Musca domestica TaxID=7370 RepID=A0A1I8N1W3_MUSDO